MQASASTSATHPPLKRRRSEMPTPPGIHGELGRVVVAHKTLGRPASEEWGDTETLAVTGRRVLPLVVAEVLARKRPLLDPVAFERAIAEKLNYETYDELVTIFGLRDQLYCTPAAKEYLNSSDETDVLLHSWVAAVYFQDGLSGVLAWLGPSIDPAFDPSSVQKRFKSADIGMTPHPPNSIPPPIPPLASPQQVVSGQAHPVAALNELAAQRAIQVTWTYTPLGSDHQRKWTVHCSLNGEVKGSGNGDTKKFAQQVAAKEVLTAMGWNTAGGP